jgi:L-threonylcarbamoyladenylate synthase
MSRILSTTLPNIIQTAQQTFLKNGVVVIPTDTVYGVSVRYDKAEAIEKLYELKNRGKEKALPILIGALDQLEFVAREIPPAAQRLIQAFWPGGLTIILPKKLNLPKNLSDYDTVGIRMPNHEFVLQLMQQCGPLATTSANISGGANPTSIADVLKQLEYGVDLYLDDGPTAGDVPSTVVDCSAKEIKILREGVIPSSEIFKVLK